MCCWAGPRVFTDTRTAGSSDETLSGPPEGSAQGHGVLFKSLIMTSAVSCYIKCHWIVAFLPTSESSAECFCQLSVDVFFSRQIRKYCFLTDHTKECIL